MLNKLDEDMQTKYVVIINNDVTESKSVFFSKKEAEEYAEKAWGYVSDYPHGSVYIIEEEE